MIFIVLVMGKILGVIIFNFVVEFKKLDNSVIENFNNLVKEEKVRFVKEKKLWKDILEEKGLLDLIEVWKELCVMYGKCVFIYL